MKSLTGSHLSLTTLPDAAVQNIYIPAFGNELQDANYIYVPDIQQMVNKGFYGSAVVKPTKSVTVDVYNGSGTGGLAGDAKEAFASQGYTVGQAADASAQSQTVQDDTQVFYGAGAEAERAEHRRRGRGHDRRRGPGRHRAVVAAGRARRGAARLDGHRPAGGLETYGGTTVTAQDFITAAQQDKLPASEMPPASATAGTQSVSSVLFGARLQTQAHPTANPTATRSASSASSAGDDQAVPANARYGIPCVY